MKVFSLVGGDKNEFFASFPDGEETISILLVAVEGVDRRVSASPKYLVRKLHIPVRQVGIGQRSAS